MSPRSLLSSLLCLLSFATGVCPQDAKQEAADLSPPERRRRLEYYVSIINLSGVAAAYADLKGMKDEASQLRKNMGQTDEKVKALIALMKQEGQNAFVDDTLRPTDRMTTFDNQTLEKIGKEESVALLGTFVAKVKGGSRARVAVLREGGVEEFMIRFDERPKDLQSIVQLIGLIPGQDVVRAPNSASPSEPEKKVVEGGKKTEPVPDPVVKPREPLPTLRKAAQPEATALKEAEKLVREIFKEDYAKKAPADKTALARKLLQQGLESKAEGAECYLLLREARDLATQTGEIPTALRAILELDKRFENNQGETTFTAFANLVKVAKSPEDFAALSKAHVALVDEAGLQENYDLAERAATAGVQVAKKAKDIPLVARMEARAREAADLKGRAEKARRATEALAKNPDDAEAHLALGQYLCFSRGDWSPGLGHLSAGSDPGLKAVAARDLASPVETQEQLSVGDAWWELFEKENGPTRENLRKRAVSWYVKALPQTAGLNRVRIEKRLENPDPKAVADSSLDLLRLINPKESIGGEWTFSGQTLSSPDAPGCRIPLPYAPGETEYDLTVIVQPRAGSGNFEIGLAYGSRQFVVDLDGSPTADVSGIHSVDGKSSHENETTRKGRVLVRPVCTILCSVRRTGVAVFVDGLKVIHYQGDYSRLSLASMWQIPNREALFLAAWKSQVTVTKVAVKQVSGQGKLLR